MTKHTTFKTARMPLEGTTLMTKNLADFIADMTIDELGAARATIDEAIEAKKEAKIVEIKKQLEMLGIDPAELGGKKAARSKAPAKFRDPDNHDNSWSGRGRKPAWFEGAEAKHGADALLIANQ